MSTPRLSDVVLNFRLGCCDQRRSVSMADGDDAMAAGLPGARPTCVLTNTWTELKSSLAPAATPTVRLVCATVDISLGADMERCLRSLTQHYDGTVQGAETTLCQKPERVADGWTRVATPGPMASQTNRHGWRQV